MAMGERFILFSAIFGCAILFFAIGVYAQLLKKPMWFWTGSEVPATEITDIKRYNQANGWMWQLYGLSYAASGVAGFWNENAAVVILVLDCTVGIVLLICCYNRIYKKYRVPTGLRLKELQCWEEAADGYAVYQDCMYLPTEEKYQQKMQTFLQDEATRVFACVSGSKSKGMLVLRVFPQGQAELVGISVEKTARRQGIGRFMLWQAVKRYDLQCITAETDADAVKFYRKNGFSVEKHTEYYDGQPVVRYQCVRKI